MPPNTNSGGRIFRFLKWLWDRIDPILALTLALVVGILAAFGVAKIDVVAAVILGVLTVLAFTLIRERDGRETISRKVEAVNTKLEEPPADSFFKRNADDIHREIGSINKRLENPPADFFFKRDSPEASIIQGAEKQVWLAQETGDRVLVENKEALATLLENGGRVRIISALPTGITPRLLGFRNADLTTDDIVRRSQGFHDQLKGLCKQAGQHTRDLEVRYTPYPTDITAVIADPTHKTVSKQKALIRHAGFRVPRREKLDFTIDGITSPGIIQHYIRNFENSFRCASKIVLLTGKPKSGKTTTWREVIDNFPQQRALIFYILTKSIWDNGVRTGFQLVTSLNPKPIPFAEKKKDESYDIKPNVLEPVLAELETARKQGKILVLDEIGPLQLEITGFTDLVERILDDKAATLFATITHIDTDTDIDTNKKLSFLRRVKAHQRTSLHQLTKDNAASVQSELRSEMEGSLRLAERLPRSVLEATLI